MADYTMVAALNQAGTLAVVGAGIGIGRIGGILTLRPARWSASTNSL